MRSPVGASACASVAPPAPLPMMIASYVIASPPQRAACPPMHATADPFPGRNTPRTAESAWRRVRSSRSGGWRRCPRRCRRESTRRKAHSRATADRARTYRFRRRPDAARRRRGGTCPSAGVKTLRRDLPERKVPAATGGTFNRQLITVIVVKLLERFNEQKVEREPHRPAPVRVTAEEPAEDSAGS